MSTRGILGVVIDGQVKATYNHSDSYPSWLGQRALEFAQQLSEGDRFEWYAERARQAQLVDQTAKPSREQWDTLVTLGLPDPGVSTGDDWYAALRNGQGNLGLLLDGGYLPDAGTFYNDSLFCEWGYLIDFDTRTLEVYRGFQEHYHAKGRFGGKRKPRGWAPRYASDKFWYPIALVRSYSLDELPTKDDFYLLEEQIREEEEQNA